VRYGEILESVREVVATEGLRSGPAVLLERFMLRHVVPRPRVLAFLFSFLAFAQRFGLDRFALRLAPKGLRDVASLLPTVPPATERERLPAFTQAEGERRGRVALFEGCVMPELFGRVNEAARRVLAREGFDVVVPASLGCCGALQAHSGEVGAARELARLNVRAFADEVGEVDALILTSAGCGAMLRELEHLIGPDGAPLASRVRDVMEFLDSVGLREPLPERVARVCYDDPCHLEHAQGVSDAPRRLLQQIPGLELAPHRDPDRCCGAAGIYNLVQPAMSRAVLSPKLDALAEVDPQFIATGNPGCMMQIEAGAKDRGLRARVVHPIELLDPDARLT